MLYFVPTPVWNIEDITLRALRLFGEIKYFICEDTRTTKKLFSLLKIDYTGKEFFSLTSFTNQWKLNHYINIIKESDVAMMSDAGTPWLSDPWKKLVEICLENKLLYSILPGATALVPAIVSSGFDSSKFVFLGFLPKKKWRQTMFKKILSNLWEMPVFFYESVHRVEKTLWQLKDAWFEWKVSISREISKMHEQVVTNDIDTVLKMLEDKVIVLKGEFVVWLYIV